MKILLNLQIFTPHGNQPCPRLDPKNQIFLVPNNIYLLT